MDGTTQTRLDAALGADDIWSALYALAEEAPPDLLAAVEARYGPAAEGERRHLSWLLRCAGERGDPTLLRLLGASEGDSARDLLYAAVQRKLRLPAAELRRLARDLGEVEPLVDAMGLSGDLGFAPFLGDLLDSKTLGGRAALALGRLGAREWTVPVARRLPGTTGLVHVAFTVALELLDDPAAIPHLLSALKTERIPAGDLHHALVALTGRDPLLPVTPPDGDYSVGIRRAWQKRRPARPAAPSTSPVTFDSPRHARFTLDEGRGGISIDYDPPRPGSSWPRWDKSLRIGGQPVYRVGSDCDTCETTLSLLGWPTRAAQEGAERLRSALADVAGLAPGILDAAAPLVEQLRSGHYRVHLADLALERVTDPGASWLTRRRALREDYEPYDGEGLDDWPGTDHFQLRDRIPGESPTYGVLFPSQPLVALDTDTVARYTAAIAAGRRPAALALAWVRDIYVQAEHPERFLVAVALDGHHKLAAYAAAGVPARLLLLSRAEDNWGPEEGWSTAFNEVLAATAGPVPQA
ncbi:hypothetical protein [Streptomyces sp. NBC_00385]|uniref:hypothetical protein n=1 Tax=Streptomyces sp. NBC_00385 TaxID=2975733 RepID=UPI002DDB1546|nr:hypothetical protein [Streptomyces sp. NBC_00385]WRZ05402.1 hypothetical protein OG959_19685 [Streptomyces sp. NBC_00385]